MCASICGNLVRLNPDGSLDTSWGLSSSGYYDHDNYDDEHPIGLAELSDGSLIVGLSYSYWVGYAALDVAAIKILPAGTGLDTTFGTDGRSVISLTGSQTTAGMALLPDGRILLTGNDDAYDTYPTALLARLNPDGSLDTTFGTGGVAVHDIGISNSFGQNTLAVQADGRIIMAARSPHDFGEPDVVVARFNTDGSLDTTFGATTPGTVGDGVMNYNLGFNEYAGGAWVLDDGGRLSVALQKCPHELNNCLSFGI